MALFFLIGLFAALAGFLYGQWLFLLVWGTIFCLEIVYRTGKQAGKRETIEALEVLGGSDEEYVVAQREAAKQGRQ